MCWPSKMEPKDAADIREEHGPCVCFKCRTFDCIEWQHVHTSGNNDIGLWSYLVSVVCLVQHMQ